MNKLLFFLFFSVLTVLYLNNALSISSTSGKPAPGPDKTKITLPNKPAIGFIDIPANPAINGTKLTMKGWTLDMDGVVKIKIRINQKHELDIDHGLIRNDVAKLYSGYPDANKAGFILNNTDLGKYLDAHNQIEVVVVDTKGAETVIGSRFVVNPDKMNKWKTLYERNPQWINDPFYFLHATSAVRKGGGSGLFSTYAAYISPTMRIGLRVPILYMRTTLGKNKDWMFDPNFDTNKLFAGKPIADDSLQNVINYAVSEQVPVLFTLNGGVWADANGTAAEWDLTDHLEEDPGNCQWSQNDEVLPDNYLKKLPGSTESPELARALTLNVFAEKVHHYKKRNLQAAGKILRVFQQRHPDLFAGINLDADTYLNPFFKDRWHDYNPNTIRQFREWLSETGLYSIGNRLERYRRKTTFNLNQLNTLAGTDFMSWNDVDPPRQKPAISLPHDKTAEYSIAWIQQWEMFRRHLVDMHYDDLSVWLNETGIHPKYIYSSQGFSAPHHQALPFAIHLDSPVKNYDSGGMSVEGSVPLLGHLGAILYGNSALNNIRMENDKSLFETFYEIDPDWAIVEFNTSDFKHPELLANYASAYRSLRDAYNYQARFISAMAWNGSNGKMVGKPGFTAHTALRNTPMELAIKDFMVSHAFLPRSALMWEFGTPRHNDYDRWTASIGSIKVKSGALIVKAINNMATLLSPAMPSIEKQHNLLVLGIKELSAINQIEVFSQHGKHSLSGPLIPSRLASTSAGIEIPLQWKNTAPGQGFEIVFTLDDKIEQFQLDEVVLLPYSEARDSSLSVSH